MRIESFLGAGLAVALTLLGALLGARPVLAQAPDAKEPELPSIAFSNLVYRLDGAITDIGVSGADMRVLLIETLRAEGFPGVGAESLVFARDDSAKADFALGGTLREVSCNKDIPKDDCCRVGVDWELLDVVRDQVVYQHRSRYGECHLSALDDKVVGRRLLIGALRSLLHRDQFSNELRARKVDQAEKPYAPAKVARCKPTKIAMDKGGDAALDATVIIESGKGHGSGFILSSSGLIMTAAHVLVNNEPIVKTRDGISYRAHPVRISHKFDVALLKADLSAPLPETRCLTVNAEQQRTGAEVYAIGAPASQELGFSMTRGIVSGLRQEDGVHYLQTDTPVSPGNSGGPLVDAKGRVVAVVVSKLAGQAMEGIGFGIPIDIALRALALTQDAKSDSSLENASAIAVAPSQGTATVDPADAIPTLVRDQGRVFDGGGLAGSTVQRRRDPKQAFDVVQGWFYLGASLDLYMLAAPQAAKDRVSVRLQQKWGASMLEKCSSLELVVNGRVYPSLKTSVESMKSAGREMFSKIEGQFDLAALRRIREHAPTITVRGCDKRWTFAPTQLAAVHKLVEEYESLAGGAP